MANGHGGRRPGAGRRKDGKNPGRPPNVAQTVIAQAKRDLMSRARDIGDKALAALEAVLDDPHASSPARVSAAVAVLDRGYGKPPQLNTGSVETLKKATELTNDELAQSIDAVRHLIAARDASREDEAARATESSAGKLN